MLLYNVGRSIFIFLFKVLFRLEVFGLKNIPKKGGFILASNHVSHLDPIVLGVACKRPLNYMARHDLFNNPCFGWILTHVGVFKVKRQTADLSAIREAMHRVRLGFGLVLFPEGTRNPQGLSLKPQAGVGFLMQKLNVPVIPAFIKGTEKILPKGKKLISPHKVSVYFGKPRTIASIISEGIQGKEISIERRLPYEDIAHKIMQDIRQLSCPATN